MIRAVYGDALLNPATSEVTGSGKRDGVAIPPDAQTIDAEGLTLLPRSIDCHADLTLLSKPENIRLVVKGGHVVKS